MTNTSTQRILIVGGVAGGASAATRARRMNEDAEIIVFEKDEYISFANCGMPYHIGGEIESRDKLLVATPALLFDRFRIQVRTFHEVRSIDIESNTIGGINLETQEPFTESYDKLILAPGASPLVPPIEGIQSSNIFTLRNMADMDRILSFVRAQAGSRVAIVGAGFIGIEMAEQLKHVGIDVSLIELQDQVLPPLDYEMARPIQKALEEGGIEVHLGSGIHAIESENGQATAVSLDNGDRVEVDAILLGMGVRPNTQLAQDAGLAIGQFGGISVNEYMQTSDADVYAVGDAVEYLHGVLGIHLRVPLAGPANRAGRIAGEHAATGHAHPMKPVIGTAIVRAFELSAAMTGLSIKQAKQNDLVARSVTITANNHAGYYPGAKPMLLKLVYEAQSGRVLGAQSVGEAGIDKRIDVIATAIALGASVEDLAGLDLVYAPPFGSAKDPVHMAAFAASNDLDGISPLVPFDADLEGYQVVDVRNPDEVERQPLEGAINIPMDALREGLAELDPARPTIVTCHSGLRAHTATRILKQHGFEEVSNLSGGMSVRGLM